MFCFESVSGMRNGGQIRDCMGYRFERQDEIELRLVREEFDGRATVSSDPVLNHEVV